MLVDTGAWLAVFHPRDQYHAPAVAQLRRLRQERARLVVTDLILGELHLHLVRGLGSRRAAEHLETLIADPLVEEVFTDAELQAAAIAQWLRRYSDQPFTLTDAVSFAAMRAGGVAKAFTFDDHFTVAGFERVPPTATVR